MDAETVLLPICVAIALIGIVLTGLAWRRRNKGRVLQGAALTIVPFGLYLTGLLTLLWDAVVSLAQWATRLVFSPKVWIGFSILAFCVVLFVIGALLRRASGDTKPAKVDGKSAPKKSLTPAKSGGASGSKSSSTGDPELDEIEALLKSRGID